MKDKRKNKGKNKLPDIDIDEIMRQAKLAALMGRDLAEEDGIPSEEEMEAELEFSEEFLKKEAEMLKALTGLDSFEAVKEDLKRQADAKDEKKQIEKRAMDALYNEEEAIPFGPDSPEFDEILKKGIDEYFKIQAKHIPSREQLDEQYEFSEEYQKKKEKQLFRKLGYRAPREKRRFSEFQKIAAVIAIIILVFVGTSNTASAFRLNVVEMFTKVFSTNKVYEVTTIESEDRSLELVIPDLNDFEADVIQASDDNVVVKYTSDTDRIITYLVNNIDNIYHAEPDSETKNITVNDAQGTIVYSDTSTLVIWYRENYSFTAIFMSGEIETDMLDIARELDTKGRE